MEPLRRRRGPVAPLLPLPLLLVVVLLLLAVPPLGSIAVGADCVDSKTVQPCNHRNVMTVPTVTCDEVMRPTEVAVRPKVQMKNAKSGKKHLLLLVDPDAPAPSEPTLAYHMLWIVSNIEASAFTDGNIKGNEVLAYEAPAPYVGIHRYQFFVFEQPDGFAPTGLPSSSDARDKFNLSAYVRDKNLCQSLLGVFQFQSTNEDVPPPPPAPISAMLDVLNLEPIKGESERPGVQKGLLLACLVLLLSLSD